MGTTLRTLVSGAVLVALAGCVPATAPQQSASGGSSSGAVSQGAGGDLGAELNAFRRASGRGALAADSRLTRAAQGHASYLASSGKFTHTGRGGSNVGDRVRAAGVRSCLTAENLSGGRIGAGEAVEGWKGSSAHRRNMLLGEVSHYGVARVGSIWVLVLAKPC